MGVINIENINIKFNVDDKQLDNTLKKINSIKPNVNLKFDTSRLYVDLNTIDNRINKNRVMKLNIDNSKVMSALDDIERRINSINNKSISLNSTTNNLKTASTSASSFSSGLNNTFSGAFFGSMLGGSNVNTFNNIASSAAKSFSVQPIVNRINEAVNSLRHNESVNDARTKSYYVSNDRFQANAFKISREGRLAWSDKAIGHHTNYSRSGESKPTGPSGSINFSMLAGIPRILGGNMYRYFESSGLNNSLRSFRDGLASTGQSILKWGVVGAGLFALNTVINAVRDAFSALVNVTKEMIKTGFVFNAEKEMQKTTYATLSKYYVGGDKDKANKIADDLYNRIEEYAASNILETSGVADTVKMAMGYGINPQGAFTLTKKMAEFSGGDHNKLQSGVYAMSQAYSYGKLRIQEKNQMINANIPINQILENYKPGLSNEETISWNELAKAIDSATNKGGMYSGVIDDLSNTMTGKIARLKDTVVIGLGNAFESTFNNIKDNYMDKVTKAIEKLINTIKLVDFNSVFKTAVDGGDKILKKLLEISGLDWSSDPIKNAENITKALNDTTKSVTDLSTSILDVIGNFKDFWDKMQKWGDDWDNSLLGKIQDPQWLENIREWTTSLFPWNSNYGNPNYNKKSSNKKSESSGGSPYGNNSPSPISQGSGYDLNVAQQAYNTARARGVSDKVILALFEAGIVESNMRNLNYGDRDSQGFLQQRPSQGWGSVAQVTNVPYATNSFLSEAIKYEDKYDSAGKLAQGIQRSAYPDKYDKVEAQAKALLAQISGYDYTSYNNSIQKDANIADTTKVDDSAEFARQAFEDARNTVAIYKSKYDLANEIFSGNKSDANKSAADAAYAEYQKVRNSFNNNQLSGLEKQKALVDAQIEDQQRLNSVLSEQKNVVNDITSSYQNLFKFSNMFSKLNIEKFSPGKLMRRTTKNFNQFKKWSEGLGKLSGLGVSENMIYELRQMGVDSLGIINGLINSTQEKRNSILGNLNGISDIAAQNATALIKHELFGEVTVKTDKGTFVLTKDQLEGVITGFMTGNSNRYTR